MVKVYRAANIMEAHIVKGLLEANGIEAFVDGHYLQGGVGELASMDFAGVSVQDSDEEAARKILEEYEQAGDYRHF